VDDIQQFIEDDYAKQYFATHRAGFIFRRRTIPLAQVMAWQKVPFPDVFPTRRPELTDPQTPLNQPLLQLHRPLDKDAVKIFRIVQRVMGDRELERPHGGGKAADALYDEERWLLGEGIRHGELRDEIYCQVMKQLTGNPSP
jgi:hypothetical protein